MAEISLTKATDGLIISIINYTLGKMLMKIKEGFVLREVAGSSVVMNVGGELSFNKMMTLNETGTLIWKSVSEGLSSEDIAKRLNEAYEISYESALNDVNAFITKMSEIGVIE